MTLQREISENPGIIKRISEDIFSLWAMNKQEVGLLIIEIQKLNSIINDTPERGE